MLFWKQSTFRWGVVVAVSAVVVASFVVIQRPRSTEIASDSAAPSPVVVSSAAIATSAAIESYAALVLKAQKKFFIAQQRYASTLEQLKLEAPTPGVTIDYRGSSPLGFCWLARTGSGVWYTISQTRVARSDQAVSAAPPISCP